MKTRGCNVQWWSMSKNFTESKWCHCSCFTKSPKSASPQYQMQFKCSLVLSGLYKEEDEDLQKWVKCDKIYQIYIQPQFTLLQLQAHQDFASFCVSLFWFCLFFWSKVIIKIGGELHLIHRMFSWSWCESYLGKVATSNGCPFWRPNFSCLEPSDHARSCCWMAEEVFAGPFFLKGWLGEWRVSTAQRICSSCRCNPHPFGEEWQLGQAHVL